jgi:Bacterial archaeo-eukaryotic release factor family 3
LPGGMGFDRSTYRDEKNREFYNSVDAAFREFMTDDELPLVVAGVNRNLAVFQETSSHTSSIIGTLQGNYDKTSTHELAEMVWPLVKANRAVQVEEVLSELDAAISAKRYAYSIAEVWHMAQEGRGSILIVETGFHYPARVDETGMFLTPAVDPTAPGVLDDAVDDIIETVMSKGGKVVFVDDGILEQYQHIAMILRY